MIEGWKCPVCIIVNAPWVPHCPCMGDGIIKINPKENQSYLDEHKKRRKNCSHMWFKDECGHKICEKCGVSAKDVPCIGGWI